MTTRLPAFLSASILLTACAAVERPPSVPPAAATIAGACQGPDVTDDREAAPAVTGRIDGCFEPGGEHDKYRLVVPGEGRTRVRIAIAGAPDRVSTFVHVEGPDRERLTGGPAMAKMRGAAGLELVAEAGAALVLDAYPNVDPREPVAWSATITHEVADGDEPNDEAATPLEVGASRAAALTPWIGVDGTLHGDVDLYGFELASGALVRVVVDEVDPRLSPKVTLTSEAGHQVGEARPPGVGQGVEVAAKIPPGRYRIRVEGGHTTLPVVVSTDEPVARSYRIELSR